MDVPIESRSQTFISRVTKVACLASVGSVGVCLPLAAHAQTAPAAGVVAAAPAEAQDAAAINRPQETNAAATETGDIIVSARRTLERLQDVPVSVQVVTGDRLEKLAVTSVEEVSKLAPGLTLVNAGSSTSVTLRGVTWQPGSGTPATPIYLNEVPFDPGNTIVSLFDVGQIEVLRGPQGTTRGAPSISGAVTISTRKPDLNEFGGTVFGLYGSGDHFDVQAAINAPIIKDVLAIRLATNIEESNANRVKSVISTIDPFFKDRTYRATVLFKPTDTLSIQGMYQRRRTLTRDYTQVVGTGSPGFAGVPGLLPAIPANFNGPALTVDNRKSVQDAPSSRPQRIDLLTLNANWEVFGHNLSYNFGRQFNRSRVNRNALDTFNILPGYELFSFPNATSDGVGKFQTNEIRFSSIRNADRPFDYDLGWFSKHSNAVAGFTLLNFTPGAFGAPFVAVPGVASTGYLTTPNPNYVVTTALASRIIQKFDSFYGNVRVHLGDRTELSGGGAIIRDRVATTTTLSSSGAIVAFPRALPAAFGGCPSPLLPNSTTYGAAFCQVSVAPAARPDQVDNNKYSVAIYNASLSHKFADDLLVYATAGSSYRSGLASIGNAGLPTNLVVPKPERAKSYEVGIKAGFGRGFHINLSAFQLDYKNQLTTLENVPYFQAIGTGSIARANVSFYGNADARVRGLEAEIAARPLDHLALGANFSYSKIKAKGSSLPCDNGSITGTNARGDLSATNPVDFCAVPKGQVLNTQAPFQATVNGSYDIPFTDYLGGYIRFNVNYQGKNPNFGNFRTTVGNTSSFRTTGNYAIVDLFAGLTGGSGAWDLGVYAKNVLDKNVELTRRNSATPYAIFSAAPGYNEVRTNLPREFGVTLRYAFGSK